MAPDPQAEPALSPKESRVTAKPPVWIPAPLRHLRRRLHDESPGESALLAFFQEQATARGYTLSSSQCQVIECMATQLVLLAQGQARSLYLHGAVGRGKSWLLDGFFQALSLEHKRRLHFHDFFARLHQGMFRHRAEHDAMAATLDELLADCQVLCFDEFHVHDIGDAMLLTRLFEALFARGVFLLVTSNYAPEGLLPNPLYHERFKPVIDLINSRMQVLEVGGDIDFRTLPANRQYQRFTQGHYAWPGDQAQRERLQVPAAQPVALKVGQRVLEASAVYDRTVLFSFGQICQQPTAVIDYLELARRFDRWIIDELPDLADCDLAAQQRFVNLVDVLYDQDKELVVIAGLPLERSLGGSVSDLMRSRSRLGQLRQLPPGPAPLPADPL